MSLRRIASSLIFIAVLSLAALAQETPKDDDSIRISSTLIQIDATVTDKKGRVVNNLRPEDFEVYENGRKQKLTNFSYVPLGGASSTTIAAPAVAQSSRDKIPTPLPPVRVSSAQIRRTYALVVDDLGLSFGSVKWAKEALRKFINEQMQDGDLVAILGTGNGIGALQSFTTDKRMLLAAVERIKWNVQSRGGTQFFDSIQPTLKEQMTGTTKEGQEKTVVGTEEDKKFQKQDAALRNENFAIGTLGALRYIIRGMDSLPGRKSLMVFSEGFPIFDDSNGFTEQTRIVDALRRLADLAGRSSVVIYTLDPRGTQSPGTLTAEDNTWGQRVGTFGTQADGLSAQLRSRENAFLDSQATLRFLADETGGVPYVGSNDVGRGLQQALDDQSGYYLLGYQPDEESFDPKKLRYNKLEVKLKNKDLRVRYRNGYLGIADAKKPTAPPTPQQRISDALTSPFTANGIAVGLYPIFTNDAAAGDVVRALVHIDAKALTFVPDENGKHKTVFDLAAVTYGENGVLVNKVANTYTVSLNEQTYRNALENGVVYEVFVPISKAGAYQFRVALRDTVTDAVGSASQYIEIPDIKSEKLALSNLVLDDFTAPDWRRVQRGETLENSGRSALLDTSRRQFKRGTILRYGFVLYNGDGKDIKLQTRLIRDGKVVVESAPTPFQTAGHADPKRIESAGALTIGNELAPGAYVLQIVALQTDAKGKVSAKSQWVDFEVVE